MRLSGNIASGRCDARTEGTRNRPPGLPPCCHSSRGLIAVDIIEFSGAEQDTFYAAASGATKAATCSSGADATVQLTGLPPESAVYVVSGGTHIPGGGATFANPFSLASTSTSDFIIFGTAYAARVSGAVTATVNLDGCNRSAVYAVGIRPESNYPE